MADHGRWNPTRWEKFRNQIIDSKNISEGKRRRPLLDPEIAKLVVVINANPDLETSQSCQGHGSGNARTNPGGEGLHGTCAHVAFFSWTELDVFELMSLPKGPPEIRVWVERAGRGWEYCIWWEREDTLEGVAALERFFSQRGAVAPDWKLLRFIRKVTPKKWFRKKGKGRSRECR